MSEFNFTEAKLESMYYTKQERCKERFISFEYSMDEWKGLYRLLEDDLFTCAYTNTSFINNDPKKGFSLERIDDKKGYSIENTVFVTLEANNLKCLYIENNGDRSKLDMTRNGFVTRIERIVGSVEHINEIQLPYKHLFPKKSDVLMKEKSITNITYINKEIEFAKYYFETGSVIESVGAEWNITYNEFKHHVSRKKCMLTGRKINLSEGNIGLFIPDKTAPIDKGNLIVTTKEIQEALDTLMVSAKMSFEELQKLCKCIVK